MKMVVTALVGLMAVTAAVAQTAPLQVSITPDNAMCERTTRIEGLTIGIWSENPQTALALGIVNGSTGQSAGLSWAFLLNYSENYKGIQWAPVNYTSGDYLGWQGGMVNYTAGSMKGLQTGALNYAGKLTGVQFGWINYAETSETGVQIGLINLIPTNEWFTRLPNELAPGMIFVNWRF